MNAHQRRAAKRRTKFVDNEIVLQGNGCMLAISVNSPGGQLFDEQEVIDLGKRRKEPFPGVSVRFSEPTHFTIEGQRQQRGKSVAESIRERLVELATRDAGPAMVLDLATGKAEYIGRPSAEVLMLREQLKQLEAPVNQKTGVPYFEVRSAGWGEGWTAEKIVKDEGFTFLDTDFDAPPKPVYGYHKRVWNEATQLFEDGGFVHCATKEEQDAACVRQEKDQ